MYCISLVSVCLCPSFHNINAVKLIQHTETDWPEDSMLPASYVAVRGQRRRNGGGDETRAPILTQNTSNDVVPRKEVPFGGRETKI